jgi:hypothetical protein
MKGTVELLVMTIATVRVKAELRNAAVPIEIERSGV